MLPNDKVSTHFSQLYKYTVKQLHSHSLMLLTLFLRATKDVATMAFFGTRWLSQEILHGISSHLLRLLPVRTSPGTNESSRSSLVAALLSATSSPLNSLSREFALSFPRKATLTLKESTSMPAASYYRNSPRGKMVLLDISSEPDERFVHQPWSRYLPFASMLCPSTSHSSKNLIIFV